MSRQPETWVEQYARWYNSLNNWTWPWDLPGKPKDFDELPGWREMGDDRRSMSTIIGQVNGPIMKIIGHKECLRWHHLHNIGNSAEYFELFWFAHTHGLLDEFYAKVLPK